MHLLVILKHTVLLSDVERKQGTRSLVSICQLARQMLQMGQRRSLADSPNGTDVKMGGEGEEGTNHLAPQFHFFLLMGISTGNFPGTILFVYSLFIHLASLKTAPN